MFPAEKLKKLIEGGYEVERRGDEVYIYYTTPTLGEAASDSSLGGERRRYTLKGVLEGGYVKIVEAYVEEEGGRRRVDIRDLELWINYLKSL
ncbi:MAG: hypothetical protein QXK71_03500 [Pyrobaculum sp.]|jgi:hypothetical protein